jgi:hypothetical protein
MAQLVASAPSTKRRLAALNRDYYGGALMLLIGGGAALKGASYGIGTLSQMGSGFFPVTLGVLLALIGTVMLLGAARKDGDEGEHTNTLDGIVDVRGWLCICAGTAAFIVLGRYGGLVPATFATVFLSALGDRKNTLRAALVLSAVMVALGIAVFWWALQLQMPLFRWG